MAMIGVSRPVYALYNVDGNTVTYSDGGILGKATSVDVTINTSEDNNLYADNGIAETDRSFTDGTLTVGTDDLSQEVSRAILGAKEQEITNEDMEGVGEGAKELIFGDDMTYPYLGVGFIVKGQKQNKPYWRGVVLPKVMFSVPGDSVTTQGETIEWQTPELTATILRDDTDEHAWKREARFSTEALAAAYLMKRLNIQAAALTSSYSAPKASAVVKKTAVSTGSEKV